MAVQIREAKRDDLPLLVRLVRESFRDVADRFGLTAENCPTHPSNVTEDQLALTMAKGVAHFILESDGEPAGCVALEPAAGDVCYLERLCVLPGFRRRGFGAALVEHVRDRARLMGLARVELAMIAEHDELRRWYERKGFLAMEMRRFEHLPFMVLFMWTRA